MPLPMRKLYNEQNTLNRLLINRLDSRTRVSGQADRYVPRPCRR